MKRRASRILRGPCTAFLISSLVLTGLGAPAAPAAAGQTITAQDGGNLTPTGQAMAVWSGIEGDAPQSADQPRQSQVETESRVSAQAGLPRSLAAAGDELWSAVGAGVNGAVYALAMDSSGNLYAGGNFTTAGGNAASRIARWDGVSWSALGAGMDSTVRALAVDSSGNLYAAGAFTSAGGVANTAGVAKWNGTAWSALGTGLTGGDAYALAVYGSNLYVGGDFSSAGGVNNTALPHFMGDGVK